MTMIRRTVLAAAAAATLLAPLAGFAADIKPRLIRFGYGLNEDSNQGRAAKFFAQQVEKASGGKMKVRAIGAAALGPDTQMQQALIGGAQEMMVAPPPPWWASPRRWRCGTRHSCSTTPRKPTRCWTARSAPR